MALLLAGGNLEMMIGLSLSRCAYGLGCVALMAGCAVAVLLVLCLLVLRVSLRCLLARRLIQPRRRGASPIWV